MQLYATYILHLTYSGWRRKVLAIRVWLIPVPLLWNPRFLEVKHPLNEEHEKYLDDQSLRNSKPISMNGLRVYIDLKKSPTVRAVFYTRRAGGPYYRWRYEELRGQWLGARMRAVELPVMELVSTSWKEVPIALKSRIDEHYVD